VLAFAVAIVIRWAYRTAEPRRLLLAGASVAAVLAILAALTVGRLHVDPAKPSATSYHVPDPGNRREAAVTSWHTFKEHPVLGSGPGSYPGQNRGLPFRAHLTPLNIAATTGLPALIAIVGMFVALWRGRSRPTDIAIWSGLLALLLDGLAQDIDHFRHVWLLIGLAAVHPAVQRVRSFAPDEQSGEVLSTR
jgi:O-antigen ligase